MRKSIFIFIIVILMPLISYSQRIENAEYFFNTDPGIGNGISLTISNPSDTINTLDSISISSLELGFHKLCIRFQDSLGIWSHTVCRTFLIEEKLIIPESPPIVAAEYFFDTEPGIGKGTSILISNPSDTINILDSISISSLELGFHKLCIRFQDSLGVWSHTECRIFFIYEFLNITSPPIIAAEYFFDTFDPGQGNATPLTVIPGDTVDLFAEISIDGLELDDHIITIRFQDSLGRWSHNKSLPFRVCTIDGPIANFDIIRYGKTVSLIDSSLNTETYLWDFGDGNTDSIPSPAYTYKEIGEHLISLIASNECGVDTMKRIVSITGVQSYTPTKGGNTGDVTLFVNGAEFTDKTTVKLLRKGKNDIIPDTTIINNKNMITLIFDLRNKTIGEWDFVIDLPGDTTIIIPSGFTIEEGKQDLSITYNINTARVGRVFSFPIIITNEGNNDIFLPQFLVSNLTDDPIGFSENDLQYNLSHLGVPDESDYENPGSGIQIHSISRSDKIKGSDIIQNDENENHKKLVLPPGVSYIKRIFSKSFDLVAGYSIREFLDWWDLLDRSVGSYWDGKDYCSKVPDYIFEKACFIHDTCYLICCVDKIACDNIFESQMITLCNEKYPGASFSKRFIRNRCYLQAKIYYYGVHLGGGYYFDIAQNKTKKDNPDCQYPDCEDKVYPSAAEIDKLARDYEGTIKVDIPIVNSIDPNEKLGPSSNHKDNYFSSSKKFPYTILFENADSATAHAQEVVITDTLEKENFDLSSFQLSSFSFGERTINVPPGLQEYTIDVPLPKDTLVVRINAKLDTLTGIVRWHFISIDPETRMLTEDPLAGFLPPNVNPPEGDGYVSYSIYPKKDLNSGTVIKNKATIIFDVNEPVITNEWLNTIDNDKPTSRVHDLGATQGSATFTVNWTGEDPTSGSVEYYNIYYSENSSTFTLWKYRTTETSVEFIGEPNSTYGFYSIAIDYAGNEENPKEIADATTIITDVKDAIIKEKAIFIYPNPTEGILHIVIETNNIAPLHLQLINILGVTVFENDIENNIGKYTEQINTNGLPAGVYILNIRIGDKIYHKKIMLSK